MTTQQTVFLVIAAAVIAFFVMRKKSAATQRGEVPANIMDPQAWEIGPVATRLGRQWIGCELNPDYEPLQRERLMGQTLGLELA